MTFSCSVRAKDLNKKLLEQLAKIAEVRIIDRLAKVCIIGNDVMGDPRIVEKIMACIPRDSLCLMCHGASRMNITLLVSESDSAALLTALHASLFPSVT